MYEGIIKQRAKRPKSLMIKAIENDGKAARVTLSLSYSILLNLPSLDTTDSILGKLGTQHRPP